MDLGMHGKVALVTGASKGIGLAVTEGLVREGAQVVVGARTLSPELELLIAGGSVRALQVDLSRPDGPAELVAFAGERIDILVNNVGAASPRPEGFLQVSDEQWLASINLDLMAAVRTTRGARPLT